MSLCACVKQPRDGAWNMIDKLMFKPAEVRTWIVIIYESVRRFSDQTTDKMITSLVRGCKAVGITINSPTGACETGIGSRAHQISKAAHPVRQSPSIPGWQDPFEQVVIDLSNIPDSKISRWHITATLEGGYHPSNNEIFFKFSKGEFHPDPDQVH